MNTKQISLLVFGMVFFGLLVAAKPVRAATASVIADKDSYAYSIAPPASSPNLKFGNVSHVDGPAVAFFHFPFTNKPAQFSSAIIVIFNNPATVAFYANVSLVTNNNWAENSLNLLNMPAAGAHITTTQVTTSANQNLTVNVTTLIQTISGADGIGICISSADSNAPGYSNATSREGCTSNSARCPVLIWTYEIVFEWYYIPIIGLASVVIVMILVWRRRTRKWFRPETETVEPPPVTPRARKKSPPKESPGEIIPPGPEEPPPL